MLKNFVEKNIDWENIDVRLQFALDYVLWWTKRFPTTVKCLASGDVKGAVADDKGRPGFEMKVYRDKAVRKPLGRNKEFYKKVLKRIMV